MNFKALILILILTLISCNGKIEDVKSISSTELEAILLKDKTIQLVDVRTNKEYINEHIERAILIDVKDDAFSMLIIDKLDKKKPVYLYCKSGKRGNKAFKTLKEYGFVDVYNLEGGISNWKHNNFKTKK